MRTILILALLVSGAIYAEEVSASAVSVPLAPPCVKVMDDGKGCITVSVEIASKAVANKDGNRTIQQALDVAVRAIQFSRQLAGKSEKDIRAEAEKRIKDLSSMRPITNVQSEK